MRSAIFDGHAHQHYYQQLGASFSDDHISLASYSKHSILDCGTVQISVRLERLQEAASGGGGGNSAYYVTGTCHFARKIGTHNSVDSCGF